MNNVLSNSDPRPLSIDDAAEAILGRWNDDGESLSESEDETATSENVEETDVNEDEFDDDSTESEAMEEADPQESAEASESPEEAEEDDEEDFIAPDDAVVEITVDGRHNQVSVKDLKRLYGQEASLTRKSQDLAAQRKQTEQEFLRTQLAYQKMVERAEARAKPYQDMDMLVAQSQMDTETFAQLRADARQAEEDLKFLKEESESLLSEMQATHQQAVQAAAQDCVKVLQDQLPDWGNDLYNEIRSYAVASGLPQEQVDQYVDPAVIMLINKARLYDQSKQAANSKKAKALSRTKGKTKVLSSKKAPPSQKDSKAERIAKAQQKLRNNPKYGGDLDDVADLLLARWED